MSHRDVGLRRVAELVVVAHGVPALIAAVDLYALAVRDAADHFPVDARVASQAQRRSLRRDDAGAMACAAASRLFSIQRASS